MERTNRILKTAGALLSVQGVTWVTSLISVAVLPRYLGAEQFGYGATAWTAVALASIVACFGTSTLMIKGIAREPEAARNFVFEALVVRTALWLAICLTAAPILLMTVDSGVLLVVLGVSAVSGMFNLWQDAAVCALQGLERLGRTSLVLGILSFLGVAISVVVLALGGGIIELTIAGGVMAFVSSAAAGCMFLTLSDGRLAPDVQRIRGMIGAAPPYLAWDLGQKVYASIDLLLLSVLAGSTAVGTYAFAYRLIGIPLFATTIVTMAVYPSLSASAKDDLEWFRRVVSNAARLCVLVTTPIAVGIAALAPGFVDLLSGGGFDNANLLVVILALHIPPVAIHTILGMALFARDQQRRMAALVWVSATVTIAANVVLIPVAGRLWGNGAIGAAIVTLTTELAMGLLVWRWAWGFIDHRLVLGGVIRTVAACAAMAIVVIAVNSAAGFFAAIAAGGITFALTSTAIGAVTVGELQRLLAQMRSQRASAVTAEA